MDDAAQVNLSEAFLKSIQDTRLQPEPNTAFKNVSCYNQKSFISSGQPCPFHLPQHKPVSTWQLMVLTETIILTEKQKEDKAEEYNAFALLKKNKTIPLFGYHFQSQSC